MKYNLDQLIATAWRLAEQDAPCSCYFDGDHHGHWTGTLDDMVIFFGRKLKPEEITILSLGRKYGPTPLLDDITLSRLSSFLFPDGNGSGGWYEWGELAERLEAFQQE